MISYFLKIVEVILMCQDSVLILYTCQKASTIHTRYDDQ